MGYLPVQVPRRSGEWGEWPLNGKIVSAHFVRYFVPALSYIKIFVNVTRQVLTVILRGDSVIISSEFITRTRVKACLK